MKTVLHGGVVVTCDETRAIFGSGDVVMEDDRIIYVGDIYAGEYDVRLDVAGRLVMPGLINAHTHSGMSILRSLADDDDLMVFLAQRVWPREILLNSEDVYVGSVLSAAAVPVFDLASYISHLVYSLGARHIQSVWINGRLVVEGGVVQTVDEAEVRRAAQATALSLSARMHA